MSGRRVAAGASLALTLCLLGLAGARAGLPAQETPLERYVRMGVAAHPGLEAERLAAEQARSRWEESRRRFVPSVSLEARYSLAEGGRAFEIPVGDLLNPVYRTLDELTGRDSPTIPNTSENFLREREQETRLRLTQVVWNPALREETRARRAATGAAEAGVEARSRALVRDIRVAYYQYANASRAVEILDDAVATVRENERSRTALWQAELATRDEVHRARAERLELEEDRAQAAADRAVAAARFNLLVRRPPDAAVELGSADGIDDRGDPGFVGPAVLRAISPAPGRAVGDRSSPGRDGWIEALVREALDRRPELAGLDRSLDAARLGASAAGKGLQPTLSLALDAGIQGTDYSLDAGAAFAQASVVLSWGFLQGGAQRSRIRQAGLEVRRLEAIRTETADQIRLQVESAARNARVAVARLRPARERIREARGAFRLVRRRQEEGLATELEFLDARAALTRARLSESITEAEALIQLAELEYALGGGLPSSSPDLEDLP
jgi:outer membrane protein TolC